METQLLSDNSVRQWTQPVTDHSETVLPVGTKRKSTFAINTRHHASRYLQRTSRCRISWRKPARVWRRAWATALPAGTDRFTLEEHRVQEDMNDDLIESDSSYTRVNTKTLLHQCAPAKHNQEACSVLGAKAVSRERKWGRKAGVRRQIYCSVWQSSIVTEIYIFTAASINVQVRVTREGRSADLHPPAEDRTLQGSTPRGCG